MRENKKVRGFVKNGITVFVRNDCEYFDKSNMKASQVLTIPINTNNILMKLHLNTLRIYIIQKYFD